MTDFSLLEQFKAQAERDSSEQSKNIDAALIATEAAKLRFDDALNEAEKLEDRARELRRKAAEDFNAELLRHSAAMVTVKSALDNRPSQEALPAPAEDTQEAA